MLRTLLGNLPGMAYRCANNESWTMEFVSAGCEELTGYAPEDLIDNAHIAYADVIAPSHRSRIWEAIQTAVAEDEAWTLTYPIVTREGEQKWAWERGVAVRDSADAVVALEGLITDVTAQHETQKRLQGALAEWRATFDAMPESVTLLDADGRVLRANAATGELTGRDLPELLGSPCHEVFHGLATFEHACPLQGRSAQAAPKPA